MFTNNLYSYIYIYIYIYVCVCVCVCVCIKRICHKITSNDWYHIKPNQSKPNNLGIRIYFSRIFGGFDFLENAFDLIHRCILSCSLCMCVCAYVCACVCVCMCVCVSVFTLHLMLVWINQSSFFLVFEVAKRHQTAAFIYKGPSISL